MTSQKTTYTDRVVRVRGLDFYTRRRPGSHGPPLLLINGLGGSLTSWSPLLEQLPDRDVLMIDTPGAGRSQTPPRPVRVSTLADMLCEVTRALGIARVDVLGYSHGGTIAQELARRHSAVVRCLVLAATIHGLGAKPLPLKVQRALLTTKRYRDRASALEAIPLLAGGRTARDPDVLAAMVATRESHPPSTRGYYFQQLALLGWSSWFWLKELDLPTLVIHGADDPILHEVNARLLAWRIRNSRLEIVARAGHLLLFDDSERVGPIIEEFLSS